MKLWRYIATVRLRRACCQGRTSFASWDAAAQDALQNEARNQPYQCPCCGTYHVGPMPTRMRERLLSYRGAVHG